MAFFGRYLEATPHSRLVWTMRKMTTLRDHGDLPEEQGGKTLLVLHDSIPRRTLSTQPSPG